MKPLFAWWRALPGVGLISTQNAARRAAETFPSTVRVQMAADLGDLDALPTVSTLAGILGQLALPFTATRYMAPLAGLMGGGMIWLSASPTVAIAVLAYAVVQLTSYVPDRATAAVNEAHGGARWLARSFVYVESLALAALMLLLAEAVDHWGWQSASFWLGIGIVVSALIVPAVLTAPTRKLRLGEYGMWFARVLDDARLQAFQAINASTKGAIAGIYLLAPLVLAAKLGDPATTVAWMLRAEAVSVGVGAFLTPLLEYLTRRVKLPGAFFVWPDTAIVIATFALPVALALPTEAGRDVCLGAFATMQLARVANRAATQELLARGVPEALAARKSVDGLWRLLASLPVAALLIAVGPGQSTIQAGSAWTLAGVTAGLSVVAAVGRLLLPRWERSLGDREPTLSGYARAALHRVAGWPLASVTGATFVGAVAAVARAGAMHTLVAAVAGGVAWGLVTVRRRGVRRRLPRITPVVAAGSRTAHWHDAVLFDVHATAAPAEMAEDVVETWGDLRAFGDMPVPGTAFVPLTVAESIPFALPELRVGLDLRRRIAVSLARSGVVRSVRDVREVTLRGVRTAVVVVDPHDHIDIAQLRRWTRALARKLATVTADSAPFGRVMVAVACRVRDKSLAGPEPVVDIGVRDERDPTARARAIATSLAALWRVEAAGEAPTRVHVLAASAKARAGVDAAPPSASVVLAAAAVIEHERGGARPVALPIVDDGSCVVPVEGDAALCTVTAGQLASEFPTLNVTVAWPFPSHASGVGTTDAKRTP